MTTRMARVAALALALVACNSDRLTTPINGDGAMLSHALPSVRVSEFHYDNTGTDVGERIEISGPAGTDVSGWKVLLYNGSGGASYATFTLSGAIPATCGTRGVIVVNTPDLQNGAPDGFALVNAANLVVEFLSYEGTFTATNGPAGGMLSHDVGVRQPGTDAIGLSLQRSGSGTWSSPSASTFGACNDADVVPPAEVASVEVAPAPAQVTVGNSATLTATARDASGTAITGTTFTWTTSAPSVATVSSAGVVTGVATGSATITATAPNSIAGSSIVTVTMPAGSAANVRVSEFHYDNVGTDADEKIEIEGDAGGSLTGWSIVLYSVSTGATTGQTYGTISLSGTFGSTCAAGTRGVLTVAAVGLQNGPTDGFALVDASGQVVEFLSYEGSFVAANGPAAGMTATNVGVDQEPAGPSGRSLHRARNGTWFGPYTSSFDGCNPDTPPTPVVTGLFIVGRVPGDVALPVGYQDQLFANLTDGNSGASVSAMVVWSSETPSIATVDQRGVISAHSAGHAIIRATAENGVTGTTTLPTEVAPLANPALYRNALAFGTPSDATPFDEIRVSRPQYELSYNPSKGTPNWVAYHLSKATRGNLPGYRCDCFTPDPAVTPLGDPGISTADYTGSGFDRGHMVRSNDRELARGDQATTYYMSNIVPQWADQNQGRWGSLETYLQEVADGPTLPEVYIFAGPRGEASRFAGGRVAVPTHTWKVAVVLRAGLTPADVDDQGDIIELIAVDMPNVDMLPRDGNWQAHKTTVDAIEATTGYDVLSALPNILEAVLESGDRAPTARITGATGGNEGQSLGFDASTSSDPDIGGALNDVLGYQWAVNGAIAGAQSTLIHTFSDNGVYTVQLIVTDRFGAADTTSTAVTILNVAPVVNVFGGATIIRGETYLSSGTFSDEGADTFTATVSYGDGSTAALSLSGTGFVLSHAYATAGTFTVTVTITDDDGASTSRTATVTVASAAEAIGVLVARVAALETAGTLSKGETNALDASLRNALRSIEQGNDNAASGQLGAFINKIEAMQRSGRLDAVTAASLTGYTNRVLASIE